jgi:hypothetical protein
MPIYEMDPELAMKVIEGYTDELAPEQKALDAFYRQHRCPKCGGACRKEVSSNHVFSDPNVLVGRSLLRCLTCEALFDPHSGVRLEMGKDDRTPEGIPIIKPKSE